MTSIYISIRIQDGAAGIGIYSNTGVPGPVSLKKVYDDMSVEYVQAMAVYEVLTLVEGLTHVHINTTSVYVAGCLTTNYNLYESVEWTYPNGERVYCYDIFRACNELLVKHDKNKVHVLISHVEDDPSHFGIKNANMLASVAINQSQHTMYGHNLPMSNGTSGADTCKTSLYVLDAIASFTQNNMLPSLSELNAGYGNMSKRKSSPLESIDGNLQKGVSVKHLNKTSFTVAILPKLTKRNFVRCKLFLACTECAHMIMITYPKNHILTKVTELDIYADLTFALTKCVSCTDLCTMLELYDSTAESGSYEQLSTNTRIAAEMFRGCTTHAAAEKVCGGPVEIKSRLGRIEYVSITSINRLCKEGTKCQTLVPSTGQLFDHVESGFLS